MCNTHMGVALPPDLAAMRETHQAKVAELDALAAEEARANPGAHAGLGASLGGKALGQEFAKRNPELAFFCEWSGCTYIGIYIPPRVTSVAYCWRLCVRVRVLRGRWCQWCLQRGNASRAAGLVPGSSSGEDHRHLQPGACALLPTHSSDSQRDQSTARQRGSSTAASYARACLSAPTGQLLS